MANVYIGSSMQSSKGYTFAMNKWDFGLENPLKVWNIYSNTG